MNLLTGPEIAWEWVKLQSTKKVFIKTVLPNQGQNPKPWLRALCHSVPWNPPLSFIFHFIEKYLLHTHCDCILIHSCFELISLSFFYSFFPSLSFFSLNPAQSPSKSCHHNDINRVPALDHCANLNLPISSFFIVMNILWGQKTWFRSSSVSSYLILDKLLSCVSVSSFFNVG